VLIVPILWRGHVLGMINIGADGRAREPFSDEEVLLISQFASHAAAAIENAKLYEQARSELTERRAAERTLRDSERKYRTLLENLGEGVCVLDPELRFRLANPAAGDLFGVPPDRLYGQHLAEFLRPTESETAGTGNLLESLLEQDAQATHRVEIVGTDGQARVLTVTATQQRTAGDRLESVLLLLRDETEREKLELQLRQAQKMEAIGTLTGGIAHDFNNILTAISGYAELALLDCPGGTELHEAVRGVLDASARGSNLTQRLLAFSRRQKVLPSRCDVNEVIGNLEMLLNRVIGDDVEIVLDLAPDLPPLKADPGQIEQVIINLVVNARDALQAVGEPTKGKRIEIRTEARELAAADLQRKGCRPGVYLRMSVTDNGVGMTPEIQDKIFDPFFTTKEVGRGTGLGLATVYGVVHQNHGQVQVVSAPGAGATFEIDWPVGRAYVAPAAAAPAATGDDDDPLILVVDDDAQVRTYTARALLGLGYRVQEASSGEEAITLVAGDGPPPDAVVSDVIMPGICGPKLVVELRRRLPRLPILLTSGFAAGEAEEREAIPPDVPFLQKPYSIRKLDTYLRELLADDPEDQRSGSTGSAASPPVAVSSPRT
jgi:PAS domain S-box-containing protein